MQQNYYIRSKRGLSRQAKTRFRDTIMAYYVCSGAKLKCSMGSQSSSLSVMHPIKPARVEGNPIAAMLDHKPFLNVKPFGQCKSLANPIVAAATAASNGKLQPMPCVPNTTLPWIGVKMSVRIKGNPALLDTSKLTCMWAGMIEITNPGQKTMKEGCTPLNYYESLIQSEEKAKDVKAMVGNAIKPSEKIKMLTVKDFAEILKKIEDKQGYEAARYYASNRIDYWKINKLARRYVDETDEEKKEEEKDNDPNLMPTRFMILYGANDEELRGQGNINKHPDNFEGRPDHEMCVEKLQEALIFFGNNIEKTGLFDDRVYFAFLKYLGQFNRVDLDRYYADDEIENDRLDRFADGHGLFSWKYFGNENENQGRDSMHESVIKDLNPEYGDDLLSEKGVAPGSYWPGICYQYPWVPFRVNIKLGDEYKGKDIKIEIIDCKSKTLLRKDTIHVE